MDVAGENFNMVVNTEQGQLQWPHDLTCLIGTCFFCVYDFGHIDVLRTFTVEHLPLLFTVHCLSQRHKACIPALSVKIGSSALA